MPRPFSQPSRPDPASLHEAALSYLGRYAATAASLTRVLERRCRRWAQSAGAEAALAELRPLVAAEVARLEAAGLLDDAAFAASRAARLSRDGRSRRAIAAHLAQHGVDPELARRVLPEDDEAELAAALKLARRRRLGPFRDPNAAAEPRRELAALARAGFSEEIARRALALERAEAERRLEEQRRR